MTLAECCLILSVAPPLAVGCGESCTQERPGQARSLRHYLQWLRLSPQHPWRQGPETLFAEEDPEAQGVICPRSQVMSQSLNPSVTALEPNLPSRADPSPQALLVRA